MHEETVDMMQGSCYVRGIAGHPLRLNLPVRPEDFRAALADQEDNNHRSQA